MTCRFKNTLFRGWCTGREVQCRHQWEDIDGSRSSRGVVKFFFFCIFKILEIKH